MKFSPLPQYRVLPNARIATLIFVMLLALLVVVAPAGA